jgi:2-methylisocitrate lyase-like PEP mutase family enzyme
VAELGALGVARVSLGSGVTQAAYATARRAALELFGTGGYETVRDEIEYPELNGLFGRDR